MTEPAAGVDVDERPEADGPATRRRVQTPTMNDSAKRRVVPLEMGGYEYDARCPKLVVWTDMATIIAEQNPRSRSERRKAGDTAPVAEGRITTDRIKLTSAMSHFLRGCLTSGDWAAIEADLADPDSDLDLPDLWASGVQLVVEFKPDMQDMAAAIGMKVPGVLDKIDQRIDATGKIIDDEQPAPTKRAPGKPRKSTPAKRAR